MKLLAIAALWVSVVYAHIRHYSHFKLAVSETMDQPGITVRVRRGMWLHYYTIGGR